MKNNCETAVADIFKTLLIMRSGGRSPHKGYRFVFRPEEQGGGADVGATAQPGPGQDRRHVLHQEQSRTDEPDRKAFKFQHQTLYPPYLGFVSG